MSQPPFLSENEIHRLLSQQAIMGEYPWMSEDQKMVESHFKRTLAEVTRSTKTESRVEWDHYGSGYASFVDVWLYKATPEFRCRTFKRKMLPGEEGYTGLVILLSRLSPCFVFMEGEKQWHPRGSSSYMPDLDRLDRLETPAVATLAEQVQPILERHALIRVSRAQLETPLAAGIHPPTILTDRGFTQFDALFYWED